MGGKSDLTLAIGEELTKIGVRKSDLTLAIVEELTKTGVRKSGLTLAIGEELTKIGGREMRSYPWNWRGTHQDWWEGNQILPLQMVSSSPRLVRSNHVSPVQSVGEEAGGVAAAGVVSGVAGRKVSLVVGVGVPPVVVIVDAAA